MVPEHISNASESLASEVVGEVQMPLAAHFGDVMIKKERNVLRLGFLNIGGFSVKKNNFKDDSLRSGVSAYDFDIFGMAETNVDWRLVGEDDRLYLRTRDWWESLHITSAFNCASQPLAPRQWGGTALFSINQAAHRVVQKGNDPSHLGRWCWTMYRGKNNHRLKVFSAYCPNPPVGPGSAFTQQRTVLLQRGNQRNPREAFVEDICREVKEAHSQGIQVIVMLDGNSDMRSGFLSSAFKSASLQEAILRRHGESGPSTFRRNQSNTPIDGIWVSSGMAIKQCGYLDFDDVVIGADHRCLWLDITFAVAFGSNFAPIVRPKARRLHCRDPRIVNNYLKIYEKEASRVNLLQKVDSLLSRLEYPLPIDLQDEYEDLDKLRCNITQEAERKCRKLRKGQVAFSPALQRASRVIKAYLLLLKKKKRP